MTATVYIPNLNGAEVLSAALESLRRQTVEAQVVVVDNGSQDGSPRIVRSRFPECKLVELGRNLGFGRALNEGIHRHRGDPIVLVNNDVECESGFIEALLGPLEGGAGMVAGVLVQAAQPDRIDSAGVIVDRTLMGFDYLHGSPAEAALEAPAPLGPTGGAALFTRAAFERAGGFDERIFAYYEDVDLAVRMRIQGEICAIAGGARALHRFSSTLGATSGRKYALTGWSRGYLLRRYGVLRNPRLAARALAGEAAVCAGQLVRDRTARGLTGRLRGWRDARSLPTRETPEELLLDISARQAIAMRAGRQRA